MKTGRKDIVKLAGISIILFIITLLFSLFAPQNLVNSYLLLFAPFFFLVTLGSRIISDRYGSGDKAASKMIYLGISAVKLFFYIAILLIYGLFVKEEVVSFFISFFIFYLIYTFIDVQNIVQSTNQ